MKETLKDYFYFTNREYKGVLFLLILLFIVAILPTIYSFFQPQTQTDFSTLKEKIAQFEQLQAAAKTAPKPSLKNQILPRPKGQLFKFDPNTASKEDFIALGLSPKVAQTFINFRNKGAIFYDKKSTLKVIGFTQQDYDRLAGFMEIKTNKSLANTFEKTKEDDKSGISIQLFDFDPNTASEEQLQQLGVSPKIAQTILNFRKTMRFNEKQDLLKIFGFKQADYNRLEGHIKIEPIAQKRTVPKPYNNTFQKPKTFEKINIEINTANAEEWKQLRGIGNAYANRIIKYRKALGGFVAITQLQEVYGIPDSTFQNIKSQLTLKKPSIATININTATKKELNKHPYFKWKQANAIVKYRKQHGAFTSVKDLSKIKVISQDVLEKVSPYLTIK